MPVEPVRRGEMSLGHRQTRMRILLGLGCGGLRRRGGQAQHICLIGPNKHLRSKADFISMPISEFSRLFPKPHKENQVLLAD